MQPFSKTYSWWSVFLKIVFQQGTTKLSVEKNKTSITSDIGMQFFDPRTQNILFSTDYETHEFHLPSGVKSLNVQKASTERVWFIFFALLMEENYCLEFQSVFGGEAVLLIQCCEIINSKRVEKISSTFVVSWFVWSLSNHLFISTSIKCEWKHLPFLFFHWNVYSSISNNNSHFRNSSSLFFFFSDYQQCY